MKTTMSPRAAIVTAYDAAWLDVNRAIEREYTAAQTRDQRDSIGLLRNYAWNAHLSAISASLYALDEAYIAHTPGYER